MSVTQTAFRQAVLDPARPAPDGLRDPQGGPAGHRFDVYRNNVVAGLSDALEVAFPVLRRLLGEEFFRAMAGLFARAHPPASPLMMYYGAQMPDFLAGFAPVAHLPYLPDIARLELALRRSYHAADAAPVAPDALAGIAPERLPDLRITLAPAVHLLGSDWPIHAIWRANTGAGGPAPVNRPEAVLIARKALDPSLHLIAASDLAFLRGLAEGHTLGEALDLGGDAHDPGPVLGLLLAQGAIAALT